MALPLGIGMHAREVDRHLLPHTPVRASQGASEEGLEGRRPLVSTWYRVQVAAGRRKLKLFCASRRARALKKSVPAGWPAKFYFGTIWVYPGEHPGSTHNFKYIFSNISEQADSTQIRSRRKPKRFCASGCARGWQGRGKERQRQQPLRSPTPESPKGEWPTEPPTEGGGGRGSGNGAPNGGVIVEAQLRPGHVVSSSYTARAVFRADWASRVAL